MLFSNYVVFSSISRIHNFQCSLLFILSIFTLFSNYAVLSLISHIHNFQYSILMKSQMGEALLGRLGIKKKKKRIFNVKHTMQNHIIITSSDLRCIFTTFLHRNIGLRRRRHQLVPVRDIL